MSKNKQKMKPMNKINKSTVVERYKELHAFVQECAEMREIMQYRVFTDAQIEQLYLSYMAGGSHMLRCSYNLFNDIVKKCKDVSDTITLMAQTNPSAKFMVNNIDLEVGFLKLVLDVWAVDVSAYVIKS